MDNVNHPTHYAEGASIECIEAMEVAFGPDAVKDFCLCNAFKYLWRFKNKNGAEDLDKAMWYVNKFLDMDDSCWETVQATSMKDLIKKYKQEVQDG